MKPIKTFKEVEADFAAQFSSSTLRFTEGHDKLAHAVCGLTEEAGEVAGLLKREVYRGQQMVNNEWIEELGDVMWYLLAVAHCKQLSLEDIWAYNQRKLVKRYGEYRQE